MISRIDHHLSNVAINYRPAGFIADRILPVVPVPKQSGACSAWGAGISNADYFCKNYTIKADMTLEDRANADPVFVQHFEEGRVHRVQDALFLDWEIRAASQVTDPANVGSSTTVASRWSDYVNSDPLKDIWTGIDNVKMATGYRPNRILFSGTAWRHFRRNKAVIDKAPNLHMSGGGIYPSVRQVKDLLELQVLVGNAWYNAAEEALPLNLTQIWQDHVLVYYTPEQPSLETPSFGYYFRWAVPGLPNMQVERHPYNSRRHCDEVEIGYYQDEIITTKSLGFLIRNVTSSSKGAESGTTSPTSDPNPSVTLARLASNAMAELHLSYSEAAAYVLRTQPALARAYRDYTLNPNSKGPQQ